MTQDTLLFAADAASKGQPVILISIISTQGSSPASPGQMMAVLADGTSCGTVGGGASEHNMIERAREAIKNHETTFSFSINHAEDGMVCGGSMEGVGTLIGSGLHLVIFGGGHISQHLAPLASQTGFSVSVIEDRADLAPLFAPDIQFITADASQFEEKVALYPGSYIVICTRGHNLDDEALRFSISKPFSYLGMIGSKSKVSTLFARMRQTGISEESLAKVYTPIGLNVASEIPAEIAVSILAEMLLIKNNGTPSHKKQSIV
ncbi:MAG: XdhC family protein [Oscillospiraceae bacterium]